MVKRPTPRYSTDLLHAGSSFSRTWNKVAEIAGSDSQASMERPDEDQGERVNPMWCHPPNLKDLPVKPPENGALSHL